FPHLILQALSCNRISKKQVSGIFIIYKITFLILIGKFSPCCHCLPVIGLIFPYFRAVASQQILLPLLCVRGHMDDYLITEDCADNSDAQSEITRGAHLNGIVSKKFLFLRISECFVAFSRL